MAGSWDFGGAFASTAGELQQQDIRAAREPASLALLEANADLAKTKAAEAAHEFSAQKQTENLMKQMSVTGLARGSAGATKLAEIFAQAGNPNAASQMMVRASQMSAQEAAAEAAKARQNASEAQRSIKMAERYGALLGGVRSQQDLDRANMVFMSEFGEATPPELQRYDPRMVEILRQATMTQAERERLALQEADLRRRQGDSEKLRQLRAAQTAAAEALAEQRREKGKVDKKVGGKDIASPTKSQQQAATDLMIADGVHGQMSENDRKVAAFDLASYAKSLQRQNPALDFSQALQRAFVEEKSRGAYVKQDLSFGDKAWNAVSKTPKPGTKFNPRVTQPKLVKSLDEVTALPDGASFTVNGKTYEKLPGGKARLLTRVGAGPVLGADEEDDDE